MNKLNKNIFTDRWDSDCFPDKETALRICKDTKILTKYIPHPFSGHRPLPNLKLSTIETNENGWRSPSVINKKFKKNIILLGGSAAWGFGATSNKQIPSYLIEKILFNKYGLEYNVINLAEQMYSSFEELQSFVSYADELTPSAVICLSGFNDSAQSHHNVFKINILQTRWTNFCLWGLKIGVLNENNFFRKIIKILLRSYKKTFIFNENYYVTKKPEKKEIAVNLFENKVAWISSYCKNMNIPVAFFLQPDLYFKKNKSLHEKNYLNTFNHSNDLNVFKPEQSESIVQSLSAIESKFFKNPLNDKNQLFCSLLDVFSNFKHTIHIDRVHFSDEGNKIIADQICTKITKRFDL